MGSETTIDDQCLARFELDIIRHVCTNLLTRCPLRLTFWLHQGSPLVAATLGAVNLVALNYFPNSMETPTCFAVLGSTISVPNPVLTRAISYRARLSSNTTNCDKRGVLNHSSHAIRGLDTSIPSRRRTAYCSMTV